MATFMSMSHGGPDVIPSRGAGFHSIGGDGRGWLETLAWKAERSAAGVVPQSSWHFTSTTLASICATRAALRSHVPFREYPR